MKGINGYFKLRAYGSDIHTFELSKSQNDIIYTLGVPNKLETVSQIYKSVPDAICAINGPLFNYDGSSEGLFLWDKVLPTLTYSNDNKLILSTKKQDNSKWSSGISYTLIQNGKIDIQIKTTITKDGKTIHAGDPYNRNPRTMIGQLKDGSIFLVAVKGRTLLNKGMKATEQAQFMLDMGCITAVNLDGGGSTEIIVNDKAMIGSGTHVGGCFVVVKKNKFIESIVPGAMEGYKKNVLPSLTIAQAILESGNGKSGLALKCFNLFGIKWSVGCGFDFMEWDTKEVIGGKEITVKAKFRKYNSFSESIADHTELLQKERYKPVLAAKDYKEACKQIKLCGYATGTNYTQELIDIIESNRLYKYDLR